MPENISPTERLLDLVIALLGSRYGHSRQYIRNKVRGYTKEFDAKPAGKDPEGAFSRGLERDKDLLRRLGIPILTEKRESFGEDETFTYRIDPKQYRVPDVRLDEHGLAVLTVAARVWADAAFGPSAQTALRKLSTLSDAWLDDAGTTVESRVRTQDPAFEPLWGALRGGHQVSFAYRGANADESKDRRVEPWGLGNKYGQWYLSGLDKDAGEPRLFRLSRIASDVDVAEKSSITRPDRYRIGDDLGRLGRGVPAMANLDIQSEKGRALRNRAGTTVLGGPRPGWDRLLVPYREPELMAGDLAALGSAVVVHEPVQLRAQVTRLLEAAHAAAGENLSGLDFSTPLPATKAKKPDAQERLVRLLAMVPFLLANQGISVPEVAEEFGLSLKQVEKDLQLLSQCGLPGYLPGELLDVTMDDGVVFVRDAELLAKPLRLTQEEACALLVGLEALKALPGTAEAGTLDQVLASVRTVAGDMVWLSDCVKVELVAGTPVDTLAQLQSFVNASHAAAIDYLVASRDEVTHRVIEPRRLFSVDSVWYVQAWCRQAGAERNFRVGNITSLVDTGETFAHREDDGDRGRAGVYTPGTEDIEVRLAVDAGTAERLADAYGATRSLLPDGRVGLSIMVGSPGTIPALMARLGGAAAVAAPEDLAAASREFLRQALDGYAGRSGIRTPA